MSPSTVNSNKNERARPWTDPVTTHSRLYPNTVRTPQCKHCLGKKDKLCRALSLCFAMLCYNYIYVCVCVYVCMYVSMHACKHSVLEFPISSRPFPLFSRSINDLQYKANIMSRYEGKLLTRGGRAHVARRALRSYVLRLRVIRKA